MPPGQTFGFVQSGSFAIAWEVWMTQSPKASAEISEIYRLVRIIIRPPAHFEITFFRNPCSAMLAFWRIFKQFNYGRPIRLIGLFLKLNSKLQWRFSAATILNQEICATT